MKKMHTHTLIDKLREMGRFAESEEHREVLFQAAERLEDHKIEIQNITTKLHKTRAERDFAQDYANDLRKKHQTISDLL